MCAIVSDYASVYSLILVRPCVVSVCVPLLVIMLHCSVFIDTSASMCCECVFAFVSDYASVCSLIQVCLCVVSVYSLIQVRPCVV